MWPAWKVSLFAFLFSFVGLVAIAGMTGAIGGDDPHKSGERIGEQYGWIVLLAPLLGYVIQKFRLDRDKEQK